MAVDGGRAAAQQLGDQLTDGFLALSGEYQLLREQHRQLEEQLSWAKKQHHEVLHRFTPDTAEDDYALYIDDLEESGRGTTNGHSDWLEILSQDPSDGRSGRAFLIRQAELAIETLKSVAESKPPPEVKIWNGPSADKVPELKAMLNGALNGGLDGDEHSLHEKDFTVQGTPSKLGCPFAKMNGKTASLSEKHSLATPRTASSKFSPMARRSKRSSFNDPIRAEINGIQETLSAVPSIEGPAGVCPIRFLDQHAPEDVATYFENHKHEIPRSHEICIKRFQSNADQVRQLDAKYGNVVSMIQGLGQKHQPMLPDKLAEDEEELEREEASDKVKNWAEEVGASMPNGEAGHSVDEDVIAPDEEDEDEENAREPHFDRPLKEVRVGESPSRPWGISVPAKYSQAVEMSSTRSPATASPPGDPLPTVRPSGCPFDHTKLQAHVSDMPDFATSKPARSQSSQSRRVPVIDTSAKPHQVEAPKATPAVSAAPQMVFTGPVFIGYSPDMIQQFMGQAFGKTG